MPPENPRDRVTKTDEPSDIATGIADKCIETFRAETHMLPNARAIVMVMLPTDLDGRTCAGMGLSGYEPDEIPQAVADALQHVRAMLRAHGKDLRVAFV
jgi:hypothetical protein